MRRGFTYSTAVTVTPEAVLMRGNVAESVVAVAQCVVVVAANVLDTPAAVVTDVTGRTLTVLQALGRAHIVDASLAQKESFSLLFI